MKNSILIGVLICSLLSCHADNDKVIQLTGEYNGKRHSSDALVFNARNSSFSWCYSNEFRNNCVFYDFTYSKANIRISAPGTISEKMFYWGVVTSASKTETIQKTIKSP